MGLKTKLLVLASRGKFLAIAHAPELCAIGGGIALVGAIVTACKAGMELQDELQKHNEKLEKLKIVAERQENGTATEEMMEIDVKVYRKHAYWHLFIQLMKLFGPTIAFAILSFLGFGMALKIINGRFAAVSATCALLARDKEHLEECIRRDYGEEVLQKYRGEKIDDIIDLDENGEVIDSPVKPEDNCYGTFTKVFGPDNPNYEKNDMEANRIFLKKKEKWANVMLVEKKDLFWNDQLEMLGMEDTQIGQLFGNHYYDDPLEARKHGGTNQITWGDMKPDKDGNILLVFNVEKEPLLGRSLLPVK